jgi:hypothetical protein
MALTQEDDQRRTVHSKTGNTSAPAPPRGGARPWGWLGLRTVGQRSVVVGLLCIGMYVSVELFHLAILCADLAEGAADILCSAALEAPPMTMVAFTGIMGGVQDAPRQVEFHGCRHTLGWWYTAGKGVAVVLVVGAWVGLRCLVTNNITDIRIIAVSDPILIMCSIILVECVGAFLMVGMVVGVAVVGGALLTMLRAAFTLCWSC